MELVAQPAKLSAEDAKQQVAGRPAARLKSAIADVEPVRTERRYKPFYEFEVTLTKRHFFGEDETSEGTIVVDALSDVARPLAEDVVEVETVSVPGDEVLEPSVSVEDATVTANSRRMQVEHRERGKLTMDESPRLVYKPVWLVELANGDVRAVDATNGRVFGKLLLG